MPNCKSFLVTEAERKHIRRRACLVAVVSLSGRAKGLSAHLYECVTRSYSRSRDSVDYGSKGVFWVTGPVRGEFRPRQTRQLPRAVDLKRRLLSCQSY